VVAFVVERVVGGADALDVHLLAETGTAGLDATLCEKSEVIVIADGVVDFESQRLLGMGVEIEEAIGSFAVDRKRIENVVAALDGEVGADGCGFAEG